MAGGIGKPLLSAQNVVKGFGGQPVLRDVSLTIHEGDRIGLIGRNGSGKSTLLRILTQLEEPDGGLVTRSQGLRVAMLGQVCRLDPAQTVGQVLEEAGAEMRLVLDEYHRVVDLLADKTLPEPAQARLHEQCEHLLHRIGVDDAWNPEQAIKRVSTALDLPPSERMVSTLSGGEARRVDLAATLLKRPDILLLDEPTNQIDAASIQWLEDFLEHYEGSCVLVTHDRYFLDRIVTRIVEIDHNALYTFPGNYTRFLEYKTNLIGQQAREEAGRQAILRRELAWVMRGARARTTKEKARLDKFKELQAQAPPPIPKEIQFEIPTPKRLGKRVLEAHSIAKRYGDQVLFRDFTMIVQHGMRVGMIGPNGCGKTTLLRVLMRLELADKGKVVVGDNTQFLYVDQTHGDVNLDQTILEYVSDGAQFWEFAEYDRAEARRIYVPGYLERFLFDRASVLTPMRNLSGGELARIDLAKKLLRGGNFIVLDEPTNDLDLPTLRVVEEAILSLDGCALIVSHDRYFLNRTCTHVVSFEGDGKVLLLAGNYDDYLRYKETHPAPVEEAPSKSARHEQAAPRKTRRGGLTWAEKQELTRMDAQIEEAEDEVARLEFEVGAPGFYRADSAAIKGGLAALDAAKRRVEALYARWQELESRRAAGS